MASVPLCQVNTFHMARIFGRGFRLRVVETPKVMTKKPHSLPETRSPNRAERRGKLKAEDEPLVRDPHPLEDQSVPDPRTKAGGHKKKTADKWNQ